ncbi:MAG: FAD-dependent oxidoreductase [Candidatus Omnitrophica bacterium]|nr:FAD-dependent oxidoreductase [Candidatus Omnitrophota bacterium]
MKIIKAKLTGKIQRTPSVVSFRLIPRERIDFAPGQFLQVVFDQDNPNNKDLNKYLSFSASPSKDYIEVTKRISDSDFSQRLNNFKINDEVLIKAPLGSCVFKDDYKKIGFLIGGIGITPVISIIEYIVEKKLNTDVVLFYSNRTEDEIAFKAELDGWQEENSNIKVIHTVTECQPKDKNCIFGRISKELLLEKDKYIKERILFIFGPPKMVDVMKGLCLETGCKGENLKTESFIGY